MSVEQKVDCMFVVKESLLNLFLGLKKWNI